MAKKRHVTKGQDRPEFNPTPEAYWRAATRRLETAMFLLENSRHYTDTIYLGGYAVECALKALILRRTSRKDLDAVIDDITKGAISHSLDSLTHRLRSRNVEIPREIRRSLLLVSEQWSTDLRYSGSLTRERPANEFIVRVESLLEWVKGSL